MPELSIKRRWLLLVICVSSVTAAAWDPYSFGQRGGEYLEFGSLGPVMADPWQVYAAAMDAILLILIAVLPWTRLNTRVLPIAIGELALFLVLNVIYVARDSFDVRTHVDYSWSPTPFRAVAAGLILRFAGIALLARAAEKRSWWFI